MTQSSMFAHLQQEPADPIVRVMQAHAADANPRKIDTLIGIYFDENGQFATFPSVKAAKAKLAANDPGHNYHTMRGIPAFVEGAQKVVFGEDRANQHRVALHQTISGTGSLHSAFVFLVKQLQKKQFYVGTPTWGNYIGMIEFVGGQVAKYNYYDKATRGVDFASVQNALQALEPGSVFVFQACCHNPTGADLSHDQWKVVTQIAKAKLLMLVIDIAYQGFMTGSKEQDAWICRYLFDQGLEFIVCQSFSKNMGLYGERVGCVHVVASSTDDARAVELNLIANFRCECLFAPAFGAQVAATIFGHAKLKSQWDEDVLTVYNRLQHMRTQVFDHLTALGTPGTWDHVLSQSGLFWHSGLSSEQAKKLMDNHHVYLTLDGRVNVAGLNDGNVEQFCHAIDTVVRDVHS